MCMAYSKGSALRRVLMKNFKILIIFAQLSIPSVVFVTSSSALVGITLRRRVAYWEAHSKIHSKPFGRVLHCECFSKCYKE